MNRYESILLDKIVYLKKAYSEERVQAYLDEILLLLDCIIEFRAPRELPVEEGCGAMVKAVEK